jgi:hypothetical protein
MTHFFLDASYLIALELTDDQHHSRASQHWQSLQQKPFQLTTTSYIFDEIITFLNSRHLHAKAVNIGRILLSSSTINFIQVDDALFSKAWQFFQQYDDKSYSLTDCISFIVMQEKQISMCLTFDQHFAQAGFIKMP